MCPDYMPQNYNEESSSWMSKKYIRFHTPSWEPTSRVILFDYSTHYKLTKEENVP